MFDGLKTYRDDPIESTFRRLQEDQRPDLVNLSIGVFRNARGEVPLMNVVRQAEHLVLDQLVTKSYLTPAGNVKFCEAVSELLLGLGHKAVLEGRVRMVQTPGAGSALRVAAELTRSLNPDAAIWFSDPVWSHQVDFFKAAGLNIKYYSYYDRESQTLDFTQMLQSLEAAKAGDMIVLHGACHNPTGEHLSFAKWQSLSELMRLRSLIPLVDIAYQGYGEGLEEDAAGLRYMATQFPNMLIAYSASKSFAVYRDRVGVLFMITPESGKPAELMYNHLTDIIRSLYFMPPDRGAEIVATILNDVDLRARWQSELAGMRAQVKQIRQMAFEALKTHQPDWNWSNITRQKGMFSCLPITEPERLRLEQDKAIYLLPDGRLNFASLSTDNLDYVASSLGEYLKPVETPSLGMRAPA